MSTHRRTRPGGRSARVRSAVLKATLDELLETGYAALTVEKVAIRAGVHKTTIYRRWQTSQSLVLDAAAGFLELEAPIPDTGRIDSDLRELAFSLVALLTSPFGRALVAMVFSEAARIPEVHAIKHEFFTGRVRQAEAIVVRALRRGEIPEGTRASDVVQALVAPLHYRLLVTEEGIDERIAERIAASTAAAARAGCFALPAPQPGSRCGRSAGDRHDPRMTTDRAGQTSSSPSASAKTS